MMGLRSASRWCLPEDAEHLQDLLGEATSMMEEEAYRGAKFYDSPTRTLRSAVNAYERFIADYPGSSHVEAAKARLEELKARQAGSSDAAKEEANR